MKPQEFANCTYREALLFSKMYVKTQETKLKNQIILFEKATDKIIKMNAFSKHPKYTSLVQDGYKDLFKEELENIKGKGSLTLMEETEKEKFILELQEELKRGEGL